MLRKVTRKLVVFFLPILVLAVLLLVSAGSERSDAASPGDSSDFVSYRYPRIDLKMELASPGSFVLRLDMRDGRNHSQSLEAGNWASLTNVKYIADNLTTVFYAMFPYNGTEDFVKRGLLGLDENHSMEIEIAVFESFTNATLHICRMEANITMGYSPPWKFNLLKFLDRTSGEKRIKNNPRKVILSFSTLSGDDTWFEFSPAPDKHARDWNGETLEISERYGMFPMDKPRWRMTVNSGQVFSPRYLFFYLVGSGGLFIPLAGVRMWRLYRRREVFDMKGFIILGFVLLFAISTPIFYFNPGFTPQVLLAMMILTVVLTLILHIPSMTRSRDLYRGYHDVMKDEKRRMRKELTKTMGTTPENVDSMVREIRSMKHKAMKKRKKMSKVPDMPGERIEDPFDVLDLPGDSPMEAVEKAYRSMIKQYHPDLYCDLPPRMRRFAQDEMKKIIWAYETIKEHYE